LQSGLFEGDRKSRGAHPPVGFSCCRPAAPRKDPPPDPVWMTSSARGKGKPALNFGGGVTLICAIVLCCAPQAIATHSVTQLASAGSAGGNAGMSSNFVGASVDGSRIFFETQEQLVPEDSDPNCFSVSAGDPGGEIEPARSCVDVYQRFGGVTTLLSTGPGGATAPYDSRFAGTSMDGARVFLETQQALVAADTDSAVDVYEVFAGTTSLVSVGVTGGNEAFNATFANASDDGTVALFTTNEQLVSSDTDPVRDIYQRSNGSTTLVSIGPSGGNSSSYPARIAGTSTTGTNVLFETEESLVTADSDGACAAHPELGLPTDQCTDMYARLGAATTLMTTGAIGGNASADAAFVAASPNGGRVFFTTNERLTSDDTDSRYDLYQRLNGVTTLLSTGPAGGNGDFDVGETLVTSSGGRVFFETREPLVSTDTDTSLDVYNRGAVTAHSSIGTAGRGNGSADVSLEGISSDGARVFFSTGEQLVAGDTDGQDDVYERGPGTNGASLLSLRSTGPTGGNGPNDARYAGASGNGSRVFFETAERLTGTDTDSSVDVFERAGATFHLSKGPSGGSGGASATFVDVSNDGLNVIVETREALVASDTDSATDVYVLSIAMPAPCTHRYKPSDLTNFQAQLNALPDASVACLDNGVYGTEATTQKITNDRLTIRSTPGHVATVKSRLWIVGDRVTVSNLILDGATTPPPTMATVAVNGDRVVLERVEISNAHSPASCVSNDGSLEGGPADRLVITGSVIYDCGAGLGHHGIYLGSAIQPTIQESWIFENADEGIRIGLATTNSTVTQNVIADNCALAGPACQGNLTYSESNNSGLVEDNVVAENTVGFPHAGNNAAAVQVSGDGNSFLNNCVWRPDGSAGVALPQPKFNVAFTVIDPLFVDRTNPMHGFRDYRLPSGHFCTARGPSTPPGP
jgi:parallel beta helix pectate lyase-like protein